MQTAADFRSGGIRPVDCYREGWDLIKDQYWLLFAVTFVGAVIGGATAYVLMGAMICGIYFCYLKALEGESVDFDLLFKGFNYFKPSLLVTAIFVIPVIALFAFVYLPLFMAAFLSPTLTQDEFIAIAAGSIALDVIVALVMVCVHTLLLFAYPLIIDRGLSGWQSMFVSARAVWENLAGIAGLWAIGLVLGILGQLAFCIGVYFVIPLIFAANVVAYRKVFPVIGGENNF